MSPSERPKKPDVQKPRTRKPIHYVALVEGDHGWWWLAAARPATSVYDLRKQIVAELEEKGTVGDTRMIIIPVAQAHIVEYTRDVIVHDTFARADIDPVAWESIARGPVASVVPPEVEAVAVAAAQAAAGAPAAVVMPLDPDDDEHDPDVDPVRGTSVRTAADARPEDEGRTVFPLDDPDE